MGLSTTCHFTASVEYRYLDQFLEYIMHLVKILANRKFVLGYFIFQKLNYDVHIHILAADDVTFALANFLLA